MNDLPPNPVPDSVTFVTGLLERQLDRANTAIKHADDKAAVIISAIGVVAGLVGNSTVLDFTGEPALVVGTGFGAALLGMMAVACALIALLPRDRSNGPQANRAVKGAEEQPDDARWHYLRSLGFAVQSSEGVAVAKGGWINSALLLAGVGVLLLAMFAAFGGLHK